MALPGHTTPGANSDGCWTLLNVADLVTSLVILVIPCGDRNSSMTMVVPQAPHSVIAKRTVAQMCSPAWNPGQHAPSTQTEPAQTNYERVYDGCKRLKMWRSLLSKKGCMRLTVLTVRVVGMFKFERQLVCWPLYFAEVVHWVKVSEVPNLACKL